MAMSESELIELAATLTANVLMQWPLVIKGSHALAMGLQANISRKELMR